MSVAVRFDHRQRGLAGLLAALAATVALTGCLRAQSTLAIDGQDRVSGEIVVATLPTGPRDVGPQLAVPPGFADRARTQPYRVEGYVGTQLFFDELGLAEFNTVASQLFGREYGTAASLELRRSGSLLTLTGGVDLTRLGPNEADAVLRVSFPGEVTDSNGEQDSGTVSWVLTGGDVNQINATARSSDPNAPPLLRYVLLGAAGLAAAVLLVGVLAFAAHRRSTRAP